jgi:hypothetical protein
VTDFRDTNLWATTLAPRSNTDTNSGERTRLRQAYLDFRDRAGLLAGEINRDLPDFTVHDLPHHLDALWESCDQIIGVDYSLNPAEAFVFGGAVLVHDLGLGLAAYPDGADTLEHGDAWKDGLSLVLRRRLGRVPSEEDLALSTLEDNRQARAAALRELHAVHAERLALISWRSAGEELFLLDTEDLRRAYGRIIGMIGQSHWWSTETVQSKLDLQMSPPADLPLAWTVDALKIACMLRTADACQLGARRAPRLLQAVRRPTGEAAMHWTFQQKLHKPRVAVDRLEYHAGEGFTVEEAPAWWLSLDLLRAADNELRTVDALLGDTGRQRFRVRGVANVESPPRFAAHVPPVGWEPVDASVQIGDVAGLVRKLGGEALYGATLLAPVRELLQNGIDAVRARRALEDRPDSSEGKVTVKLNETDIGWWLEVTDTGVGMSRHVLTSTLLDFGTSLWTSSEVLAELPGLAGRGFESIGRFGIGFFSAFMLGERVQVISRRFEGARQDTTVLEFQAGVGERPIVRPAVPAEQIRDGGTTVRVLLADAPHDEEGLLLSTGRRITLGQLVAGMAPASAVTLSVCSDTEGDETVVEAGDWKVIDADTLVERLGSLYWERQVSPAALRNMRPIIETDGRVVGRLAVVPFAAGSPNATVVGGLRSGQLGGMMGVLVCEALTAARDQALPVVTRDALATFAAEQATLVAALTDDTGDLLGCSEVIARLGGCTGALPVLLTAAGRLDHAGAVAWLSLRGKVVFVSHYQMPQTSGDTVLCSDVAVTDSGHMALLSGAAFSEWPEILRDDPITGDISLGAALAISEAWAMPLGEVAAQSRIRGRASRPFATIGDDAFESKHYILMTRPGAAEDASPEGPQ